MDNQTVLQKLAQARQAVLTGDLSGVLATDRAVVDAHHRQYLPGYQSAAEEMINIGDQTHNYPAPVIQPAAKTTTLGTLAKLAIGAGLIATGAGAGVGGLMIANALASKPAAVAPVVPATPAKPGDAYGFDLDFVP